METRPAAHPSDYILEAFDAGKLDEAGGQAVRAHLEVCPACRTRQQLRAGQPVEATAANAVGPGDTRGGNAVPEANETAGSVPTALLNVPPELANHPDYELLRELGRGGMGVVYLAKHRLSGRMEVLKVMSKDLLGQADSRERFLREIQSAARLDHKNVVKMYTAQERGERMVLVMEYVHGEDLAQVVKAGGALPVSNACYYVQQAASGLQHAFEKGMVHRDIKPQNLILAREGKKHTVKVLDFGLAKATRGEDMDAGLTGTGVLMGTPGYVASEQSLDAAAADIRADIYSLGCTLYHLLAGSPPFSGRSTFEIVQAHHSVEARPLNLVRAEVPAVLASVVGKMMAKNAAQRYQTPLEVVRALEPFVKGVLKPLPPQPAPPRGGQPVAAPPVIQATRIEGPATIARGIMKPSSPMPAPTKRGQYVAAPPLIRETVMEGDATIARALKTARPPRPWKMPAAAFSLLLVAATVVYIKWDSIAALIPADDDAIAQNTKDKDAVAEPPAKKPNPKHDSPASKSKPKSNPDEPPANKPPKTNNPPPKKDPPNLPPKTETVKNDPPRRPSGTRSGLFPRRALIVSVHDYLFANSLQNGLPIANAHNFNNLINALSNGMDVPLTQIAHLSDEAGKRWGARAPTKPIIEKTLTNFLDGSRPQDRILVFFVGHSVELGDEVYLAPIEGELDRAETLIPLKWFYEQLAKCKARQKVLVLDVNRYNRTFGWERPGSDEMGEKLDDLLKAPPAGVQVWSSCGPKQRSYACDDYPMGIFLDSLEVALQKGMEGKIQKGEEPLPLDFYVDRVNQMMKNDLSKRKLEQVSRLTGKESDEGAAYDPDQPAAAAAVASLARPPDDDGVNRSLIESVLDQVGAPPVKVTHEMALRYDALPLFPVEVLRQYQGDKPNPDSPLRKAVLNARAVLWAIHPGAAPEKLRNEVSAKRGKIGVQLTVLGGGYRAPAGGYAEKQFKDRVEADERLAALLIRAVEDALEELEAEAVKEARKEESKRWQANYDFIRARMELEYAYLFEYQSMLGSMRKEFPPRDATLHSGWKLASQSNLQGDSKGKKAAKNAKKLLDGIIKTHAGSPWEVLAKREKLTNLGLEWQAVR